MLYSASVESLFYILKLFLGISAVLAVALSQTFRAFLRALFEAEKVVARPLTGLVLGRRTARKRVVKKICWRSRAASQRKHSSPALPAFSPLYRRPAPALVTAA